MRTDFERPLPTFRELADEEVTRANGDRTAAIDALVRRLLDDPVRRERLAQLLADWQRGGFTEFTGKKFIVSAAARQLKQSSLTAGGF